MSTKFTFQTKLGPKTLRVPHDYIHGRYSIPYLQTLLETKINNQLLVPCPEVSPEHIQEYFLGIKNYLDSNQGNFVRKKIRSLAVFQLIDLLQDSLFLEYTDLPKVIDLTRLHEVGILEIITDGINQYLNLCCDLEVDLQSQRKKFLIKYLVEQNKFIAAAKIKVEGNVNNFAHRFLMFVRFEPDLAELIWDSPDIPKNDLILRFNVPVKKRRRFMELSLTDLINTIENESFWTDSDEIKRRPEFNPFLGMHQDEDLRDEYLKLRDKYKQAQLKKAGPEIISDLQLKFNQLHLKACVNSYRDVKKWRSIDMVHDEWPAGKPPIWFTNNIDGLESDFKLN